MLSSALIISVYPERVSVLLKFYFANIQHSDLCSGAFPSILGRDTNYLCDFSYFSSIQQSKYRDKALK
jgi:hypothetical protein